MGVKTSDSAMARPTHDFLKWGVECWEIFSVDIIIIELLLTIEGAKMVGGGALCPQSSHTLISDQMPINYPRVHWAEPQSVPRDCSLSQVQCVKYSGSPCPPIYLPHPHTSLHVFRVAEGSLETVIVRFVCSEDTERGWEEIRASLLGGSGY